MRDLQPRTSPATPSNATASPHLQDHGSSFGFVTKLQELLCKIDHENTTAALTQLGVPFCNASHDTLTCWPPTEAGHNVTLACPPNALPFHVTRFCLENGEWAAFTHYNDCWVHPDGPNVAPSVPAPPAFHLALRYVYLVGLTLSLVFLSITLFIFCYFKALQCTRIAIHKHLVVSFILRYVCMIIHLQPLLTTDYSSSELSLYKIPGVCRLVLVLLEYFSMANIYWMFVEGLYLTSRIAVAVFSTESNFKIYMAIGWVSPLVFVVSWAITMACHSSSDCWVNPLEDPYIWILRVPTIAAIVVNSLFLINIIRILITKLQASNTVETNQMRKAVKAVAVLFPLLGLTNLVFFWNAQSEENSDKAVEKAFLASNAVLQSFQGVFVAVIYCFMNTEVRKLVKRKVLASLDEHGKRTPRRSNHFHTTNGSCGVPTTSEVVMAVSYRRSTHDHSTTVADQYTEMKPFTAECVES